MSGINSAMLAGVTGLTANSAALASISDDIANVNTVGYKANDTQFSDLVTNSAGSGYASGGVQALTTQNISQQGVLQAASSPTDLAISGQGFFVTSQARPARPRPTVRCSPAAGAFTPNNQGYLVNAAGLYLQGWQADTNGNVTTDPSNLSLLQPVNVSTISSVAVPTSQVAINANLQSSTAVSQAAQDVGTAATDAYSASSATTSMAAYTASGGTTGTQARLHHAGSAVEHRGRNSDGPDRLPEKLHREPVVCRSGCRSGQQRENGLGLNFRSDRHRRCRFHLDRSGRPTNTTLPTSFPSAHPTPPRPVRAR